MDILTRKPVQQVFQEPPTLIRGRYLGEECPEGIGEEDIGVAVELDKTIQHIWPGLEETSQTLPVQGVSVVDEVSHVLWTVSQDTTVHKVRDTLK